MQHRAAIELQVSDRYSLEVSPVLGKWGVIVYKLPARHVVTEDIYPERWRAVARAHDFRRLFETRERKAA